MALCLSSKNHKTPMPATTTLMSFFFVGILFSSFCAASDLKGLECLKVSPSKFVSSLKNLSGVFEDVTTTLQFGLNNVNAQDEGFHVSSSLSTTFQSELNNRVNDLEDFDVSSAMSTCLNLLNLSAEELTWSVSAIQNGHGKQNGTGNLGSDIRTWLSAILANTDTCMDEFENTHNKMKSLISSKINKVNMLVNDLLNQVHAITDHDLTNEDQHPSWVESRYQNLLQTNTSDVHFDALVAADGSGNYTKVMDAVNVAPEYSMKHYVIYIKRGVYEENVEISKNKWNIVMIGEGMDVTIISSNLSFRDNLTTFKTATFGVCGRGFLARDISFRNTAGPENHQAVALRSNSDLSVFYRCGIFGYQDSLYAHSMRQFYRECRISGTVDFICGHATAVFQNCEILVKKGLPKQKNAITAHKGTRLDEPTGFSFQFCNISADFDLLPFVNSTQTYLGRPWKEYSRVIFMQSYMSNVVAPEGWLEWDGAQHLDTLYYAEFMNCGPGAVVHNRVKWAGYHVLNNFTEATNFTVAQIILGNLWLPSTGVAFTSEFQDKTIARGK